MSDGWGANQFLDSLVQVVLPVLSPVRFLDGNTRLEAVPHAGAAKDGRRYVAARSLHRMPFARNSSTMHRN
jgi:hypothetical protein